MAEPFAFELVSPEKLLVSGEALEVLIPGTEGYFQVFANHAPVMSTIKPGIIEVKLAETGEEQFVVLGGFADVSPAGLTILAEHAVKLDELDKEDLADRIDAAETDISHAVGEEAKSSASEYLDQLKELQASL